MSWSRLAPWRGRTLRFGLGAATAAFAAAVGVARNKWIALHLGAEGIGVLGQVLATQAWMGVAASLGMTVAVTRMLGAALGAGDLPTARRTAWTAITLASGASVLAAAIALIFAPQLATALLGDARYAPLIRLIAAGIAGYALHSVIQGVFAGRSDVRANFTLGIGCGIAVLVATLLLVTRWDVAGAVLAVALMFPVGIATALAVHRRDYAPLLGRPERPLVDPAIARGLLGIGGAALALAVIDQGTLLALRAHYVRAHGIAANGLLQAALAISQQAAAPFFIYFSSYAIGVVSGMSGAAPVEAYTRRQWAPVVLLAAAGCAFGMVASGPLLGLLYVDTFTPARPLMAWCLAGEFVRIAAQAWIIGALPLAGTRAWLWIGLSNDVALAAAYVSLAGVGVGMLSLPLAYGVGALTTLITGAFFMARAGVRPRLRDVLIVVAGMLALMALAARQDPIDDCLDRGGRWNHELNRCEGCRDCPPTSGLQPLLLDVEPLARRQPPGSRREGEGGRPDSPAGGGWLETGPDEGKSPAVQAWNQARHGHRRWTRERRNPSGYTELRVEAGRTQEGEDEPMLKYMVVIERGEAGWGAQVPDLPGCVAVGETREEVVGLIREAIAMHIEDLKAQGLAIPRPMSEGEFVEVEAA